ncbi:MAG: SDR family NAD(P)-dependent oxidoreductase [Sandaracinaceae bacterium]|nr:SDR family NAD(P)-dependent oxidoreductase [Sandaracinaceae bacterium]
MSQRTIVVCGHGPGISDAVARRFGKEGYAVALVARSAERLKRAAEALSKDGVTARAFAADLSKPDAVRAMIRDVRAQLGPVTVVHWNAYGGGLRDLLADPVEGLASAIDVGVTGLLAATQEALADLEAQKGAVLVTGGGLCFYDAGVDAMAVQWGAAGLAIAKAAQHKATGLLHAALKPRGVYVGEVVVGGAVKGTAFDQGQATIEAASIADAFWELHQARGELGRVIR